MASIHMGGSQKCRLYLGSTKIKRGYLGNTKVYSSSNKVTYYISEHKSYEEEIEYEATCLSPSSFIPTMEGYHFVGWREDKEATSVILTEKVMGDNPITLYAVFRRTVTLTLYHNNKTKTQLSEYYYFNNGSVKAPSFTFAANEKTDWNFSGWSGSAKLDDSIQYPSLDHTNISESGTLYAVYHKDITVRFYNNSTTPVHETKAAIYHSSNEYSYPTFSKNAAVKEHYSCNGWSTDTKADANVSYDAELNNTFESSTTLYAVYYRMVSLYYGIDADHYNDNNQCFNSFCYYNSSGTSQSAVFEISSNLFTKKDYEFVKWTNLEGNQDYNPGDSITMDGSTESLTLIAVWKLSKIAHTFIDGTNVFSEYGSYEPFIYLDTNASSKKKVLANNGTSDAWREVYPPYGALDLNKIMHHYRHIDRDPAAGVGVIYSDNPSGCPDKYHTCYPLPSNNIYLKYSTSGYTDGDSGFSVQKVDNDSLLRFVSNGYFAGSNYDTLYYSFENVPRNGCSKIRIRVEYLTGSVTIQGQPITEGYKEYEFDVDASQELTHITFSTQSNGERTELRIKYINFI